MKLAVTIAIIATPVGISLVCLKDYAARALKNPYFK
jgi:hypothetical protein